jgi:membrane protein YqaA with SNARE-associated domain
MLRRLYDLVLRLAASRHAAWWLAAVSFAEASFFPIPPDPMLAAMVFARRERTWFYAAVCTLASVAGALLGYAIGYYLQPLGLAILKFFGHADDLETFRAWYAQYGIWVILGKGLTPIPFKIVTITSGFAQFSIPKLIVAAAITRGFRFFLVAFLIRQFGPAIQPVIEKRLTLFTTLFLVLLIGGVIAIKFLA